MPVTVPLFDKPSPTPGVVWNTTTGSLVHRLSGYLERIGPADAFPLVKLYIAAVALTFLPLVIAALLSPLSLTTAIEPHKLPLLYDWNVSYMLLVSFPCLAVLTVSDQQVLTNALRSVQADGTMTISHLEEAELAARWRGLFRTMNLIGLALATIVGLLIAYLNFRTYAQNDVGFWITKDGVLLPVGYVFLYCIFLFYALVTIYIVRNIAISLLLRQIVARAQIHMLPLHPDKSGGLRPVGRLGLRNQYALTLLGLNVVLLIAISRLYLDMSTSLSGLIVAAVVAYLVLGPLVFIAPLLPFRSGMLKSKSELMSEVALRMRIELDRLRSKFLSEEISQKDEELVERLRKIGAVIDELPVWPFDSGTLRKFLTAYVVPIAGVVGYPIVKLALDLLDLPLGF